MKKKYQLTIEELGLFREGLADIEPLAQDRIEPYSKRPKPLPRHTQADEQQVLVDMMSEHFDPLEAQTGEELYFARTGIQHSVLKKLRRGQFRISAELDLHGLFVAAARQALVLFLQDCIRENWRCVRIIHGKGLRSKRSGPVLKSMVNQWLKAQQAVLAFASAPPQQGGTGAVCVLLKQQRHGRRS